MIHADAYAELKEAAREPAPPQQPPDPLDDLNKSINRTYFMWRRWIALLAIAVPLILWLGGLAIGWGVDGWMPLPSISRYYFTPGGWLRDIFVAAMCAIGLNLYFYRGYTPTEDLVLDLAGLCAALVGLVPMTWAGQNSGYADPRLLTLPWLHNAAAITLFIAMAYVCVFESNRTLKLIPNETTKARFRATYRVLGFLMVATPIAIFLLDRVRGVRGSPVIFAVEAAGVFVFATYWLVKSSEIATILKLKSQPI